MANEALGVKGYAQFSREAAYGTLLAATHRIAIESCTLEPKPQIGESQSMPAAGFSATAWMGDADNAGQFVTGEHSEGQLVMPMDYDGLLQFVDMAMGTATYGSYGATVTGPDAHSMYTHTWSPEREKLNSITLQFYEGGVLSNARNFPGLKCTGMTLRGSAVGGADGIVKLSVDLVGRKSSYGAPTGALSMIPRVPMRMSDLAWYDGFKDQTSCVLREFEFSIKPSLAAPIYQAGSTEIREPIRDGLITTTLKLVREYNDTSAMSQFVAGGKVSAPPVLTFTNGYKSFTITFNAASIMSNPQPRIGLKGIMVLETVFKALWSGSSGGVTIAAVTAQTGAQA